MFKTFVLVLAFGSANAATIVSTVTCNGDTYTTSGTASCFMGSNPSIDNIAQASTMVNSFPGSQFSVGAGTMQANRGTAFAHISFTDTFYVTVTGGVGYGFIDAYAYPYTTHGGFAGGTMSCGGTGLYAFTYDVPVQCTVWLDASASAGRGFSQSASVYLAIKLFDSNHSPATGSSYTIGGAPTAIPEPASFATCGLLLAALLTRVFKRKRSI